jgi:hypothetical protein
VARAWQRRSLQEHNRASGKVQDRCALCRPVQAEAFAIGLAALTEHRLHNSDPDLLVISGTRNVCERLLLAQSLVAMETLP